MKTIAIAIAALTMLSAVAMIAPEAEARPYCTDLVHDCDATLCYYTAVRSDCVRNPCDPRWCDIFIDPTPYLP